MHWTVEKDAGRVVEIARNGVEYAREEDRFLVVRWANGTGTIEVDCPSEAAARRECRRLRGEPMHYGRLTVKTARQCLDPVLAAERRYDQKWDGDQLSLLID